MSILRIAIATLAVVGVAHSADIRTWTGANGKELQAEFIRESGGLVSLRTSDGQVLQTKRSSLSQNDQKYLDFINAATPVSMPQAVALPPPSRPAGPPADNSFLVTKTDHFGIRLGESVETLEWNCQQVGLSINKNGKFEDKDHPGNVYLLSGAVNGNEAIKTTKVLIYNGRVYQVEFLFEDSSPRNYDVLTTSLEKKYGKIKASDFQIFEKKSTFTTTEDGQKLQIILKHTPGFMDGDTLSLYFVHDKLTNQLLEELKTRKASKVASDL